MNPTPTTPPIDFADIRSRCPRAFAALMSFVRHRADLPSITPAVVYTWLSKHPRDLFDFFDEQGMYVNTRMDYVGRELRVVWGSTLEHVSDSESPGELIPCPYPTRPAAEAAAFTAGFEKLEEMLAGKEKEG